MKTNGIFIFSLDDSSFILEDFCPRVQNSVHAIFFYEVKYFAYIFENVRATVLKPRSSLINVEGPMFH